MDHLLKYLAIASSIGLLVVVTTKVLNIWASGRSMERTQCYKTAATVDECGAPNQVEKLLAKALGPQRSATE